MTTFPTHAVTTRSFRLARIMLTTLAGLLFAVGWVFGAVWVAVTWVGAAISVGFLSAHDGRADRR